MMHLPDYRVETSAQTYEESKHRQAAYYEYEDADSVSVDHHTQTELFQPN